MGAASLLYSKLAAASKNAMGIKEEVVLFGIPSWDPFIIWGIVSVMILLIWFAPKMYRMRFKDPSHWAVYGLGAASLTAGAMTLGFANEAGQVNGQYFWSDPKYQILDLAWGMGEDDPDKLDCLEFVDAATPADRAGMCALIGIALGLFAAGLAMYNCTKQTTVTVQHQGGRYGP